MQLSKTAYYADFAIYAAVLAALSAIAVFTADWGGRLKWFIAFAVGWATWTLLEYLLHRFVLHRVRIVSAMHGAHHAMPRAFVGTPTWVSLPILSLTIFLPAWWTLSPVAANGLMAGVMMGFLWYGILHHAIHHGRPRLLSSRLSICTRRHMRHHYSNQSVNFGVTTALWDCLFGTIDWRESRGASCPQR